jgi:DNA-binding phage protein
LVILLGGGTKKGQQQDGFENLAAETSKPASSLDRMLSSKGNPSMDSLAAILGVVRKRLGVELQAHTVEAA